MERMPIAAPMIAEAGGPDGTLADIMPVRAETGNGQPWHRCARRKAWRDAACAGGCGDRPVRVFVNGLEPGMRAKLHVRAVVVVRAARMRLIDASGRRALSRRPRPSRSNDDDRRPR
ncbi:hypothetical protein WS75_01425 [Burkholderia sp. FL-7-2-10-S1-D7]|uniref:hypothetical protein n=1 Tax=Burkholderia sp. FL-7-2-10-S1-D7 TaxID=1637866 RepID=UPI00075810F8|nr:hypothetical protein [Burkholderia sp. FL-7-2-10-S1-D7]KVF78388.1 hypothetical protein WS75_01425 [Burkholderia sp. FL-7-2-10-S1-D7]